MRVEGHEIKKDKIEIVSQSEKKYQLEKLGTLTPHKGHTLFQINLETGEVTVAEFERVDVELSRLGAAANYKKVARKVIQKKDCIYISALNQKNAIAKFARQAQKLL